MAPPTPGMLYIVGLGPGDPELMTLKAARIIANVPVVAFFARRGRVGQARSMVEGRIDPKAEELRLEYPFTTEIGVRDPRYAIEIDAFYEVAAAAIATRLDAGQDVALLCEGDPFFYGSPLPVLDRLGALYPSEVIPGVTGMSGCWSRAGIPMVHGDDVLTVLPGTLDEDRLVERLGTSDAAVIMKVGRNFEDPGGVAPRRAARAGGLCRTRHDGRRTDRPVGPCGRRNGAVFFADPGAGTAAPAMSGKLWVVGLGPGDATLQAPRAAAALAGANDLVGYATYVDRVPPHPGQVRHVSDNREELPRARHALSLAAAGRCVALVSSGDAGVFAMASTVLEAVETGDAAWRRLDIEVVPGISAMFAAAARIGAPLGHDFCAISLSDNLKPWDVVVQRLTAAASAGFVIALYNPLSRARPWQLGAAFDLLRSLLPDSTPIAFATAVSCPDERIDITTLGQADPARADMRTLVLIGSAATRRIDRGDAPPWLYSPRRCAP